jgi:hypothetical protein
MKTCGHSSGVSQHFRKVGDTFYCEDCIFKMLEEKGG